MNYYERNVAESLRKPKKKARKFMSQESIDDLRQQVQMVLAGLAG